MRAILNPACHCRRANSITSGFSDMQLLEHDGNWTVLMDSYNGKKLNGPNDDFRRPNGLCFSPDEKKLYVVDTGAKTV